MCTFALASTQTVSHMLSVFNEEAKKRTLSLYSAYNSNINRGGCILFLIFIIHEIRSEAKTNSWSSVQHMELHKCARMTLSQT
jgi:hypothetical protein